MSDTASHSVEDEFQDNPTSSHIRHTYNDGVKGVPWVKTVVMPHVEACKDSPKSKQRLLSLKWWKLY